MFYRRAITLRDKVRLGVNLVQLLSFRSRAALSNALSIAGATKMWYASRQLRVCTKVRGDPVGLDFGRGVQLKTHTNMQPF